MNGRPSGSRRLALLAVAIVATVALAALPTTAFAAKATTKIVVTATTIVNHATATTNLWPVTQTAKLQKKSGSRYVGFKGSVRLYRLNPDTGKYVYVATKTSSSSGALSLSVPMRGKYKIAYAGSSKLKACNGYTTLKEAIGDTIAMVGTPTYTPIAGGPPYMWWITVRYDVNWNTAAWDGPVVLDFEAELENEPFDDDWRDWVAFRREIFTPGTVEFNWKVENPGEFSVLATAVRAYVPWWDHFQMAPYVSVEYGTP
jgi:hypothetical protein